MRVMVIVKANKDSEAGVLPSTEILTKMGKYNEQLVQAGVMLAGEGLQSSAKGKRVKFSGNNRVVTDGPFAETKELIAGFAIVRVKSKGDASELAKRFLKVMGEGESEVRLMHDTPAFEAGNSAKRPAATAKR